MIFQWVSFPSSLSDKVSFRSLICIVSFPPPSLRPMPLHCSDQKSKRGTVVDTLPKCSNRHRCYAWMQSSMMIPQATNSRRYALIYHARVKRFVLNHITTLPSTSRFESNCSKEICFKEDFSKQLCIGLHTASNCIDLSRSRFCDGISLLNQTGLGYLHTPQT